MKTIKYISETLSESGSGFVILEDKQTFNETIVQMNPTRFGKFINKFGKSLTGKAVGVVNGWIYPFSI